MKTVQALAGNAGNAGNRVAAFADRVGNLLDHGLHQHSNQPALAGATLLCAGRSGAALPEQLAISEANSEANQLCVHGHHCLAADHPINGAVALDGYIEHCISAKDFAQLGQGDLVAVVGHLHAV